MKSKSILFLTWVLAAFFSVDSFAASSSSSAEEYLKNEDNQMQDLSVPLANNKLQVEIAAEQAQRERAHAPFNAVDLSISSWQPKDIQMSSRIQNATGFTDAGVPTIQLSTLHPLTNWASLKLSLGLASLHRYGTLDAAGQSTKQEQMAYLPYLGLGAEFTHPALSTRLLKPYFSASLQPSLVITTRSAFDDGQSALGFPFGVGAGVLVHAFKTADINIGATETLGSVKNSDVSGLGLNAGVRLAL